LEHTVTSSFTTGRGRGGLITGAGGQLGSALAETYPEALAWPRARWDVRFPLAEAERPAIDLVLHAAAWTDVEGAEDDPQGAAATNVGGTQHVASLGVPLVYFSSDYVFDGTKGAPYLESDPTHPVGVYGASKLHGEAAAGDEAWIVRTSWLFGPVGHNFLRTMLHLGATREEVRVVDDQRGCPTYTVHLSQAVVGVLDLPYGVYHLAADGECSWAEFAEAIFAEADIDCHVRRVSTAEYGAKAPRPPYSVLRSEKGAPTLPHWREGLRACLERAIV
jgi:dTDP-4-dehydrorhamnose reductase